MIVSMMDLLVRANHSKIDLSGETIVQWIKIGESMEINK